jgi:lysyl-tRNA synthetase class 2
VRFVGVRLVALLIAFVGSVNLLTSARPNARLAQLAASIDGGMPGRAPAFIGGVLLVATARGLVTRRYAAWLGAVVVASIATLAALAHRPHAVLLVGGSLAALVMFRGEFPTRPDPARLRLAGQIGLIAVAAAIVGGGWDLVTNRRDAAGVGRAFIVNFATGSPDTWRGMLMTFAIAGPFVIAVLVVFLPAAAPPPAADGERVLVRYLAAHGDADSLAPFATRADKSYVFSPDRAAAIGYRVLFGTALVGGDPVGAAASAPAAMRAYLEMCRRHGWRPAVLGSSDAARSVWRELGLHGLHVGDEAVLDVDTFSLASRRMRNVRQAVNRTRNAGLTVEIGPLTTEQADRLHPVLTQWLGGRRERGFAMNLDGLLTPRPDCLFAIGYAPGGEPVAFARFALCGGGTIYTLDVAPRGILAPNGSAERLIVEIVDYARSHGGREVSLNFAALRWIFGAPGLSGRTGAALLHSFDRWIEIASLNRFCEKFQPRWRARSLLVPSWTQMGWVVAAALRAEFGVPKQRVPAPEALGAVDVGETVSPTDALPGPVHHHAD